MVINYEHFTEHMYICKCFKKRGKQCIFLYKYDICTLLFIITLIKYIQKHSSKKEHNHCICPLVRQWIYNTTDWSNENAFLRFCCYFCIYLHYGSLQICNTIINNPFIGLNANSDIKTVS